MITTKQLHGDQGDWCCLPRNILDRWGGGNKGGGLLPGKNDYFCHFLYPRSVVSLHCHSGSSIIRLSGYQASLFRYGRSALLLNTHRDAINHEPDDIYRLTGARPAVSEQQEVCFEAVIDNDCPEWVVFHGMWSGERVMDAWTPCIMLKLPTGTLWMALSEMVTPEADEGRRVYALTFGTVGSHLALPTQ